MSTENASGCEAIRQALVAQNKKVNLASVAQDIGVPSSTLEAFMTSAAKLAPEILTKLAERIWMGHLTYNVELDCLQPANKTPPTTVHAVRKPVEINAPPPAGGILGDAKSAPPAKPAWLR